jgi:hypothetical protein
MVKHNINENEQYITRSTGDEFMDKKTQKYAFVFNQNVRAQNRQT